MANQSGATAIEYGLIAGLIFLAIVTAIDLFGASMTITYGKISAAIAQTSK